MQRSGEPSGVITPEADRAARWTLRLTAVALFVVVIAVVLRLSLLSLDKGSPSSARQPGGAGRSGPVTVEDLGPQPGVDLAAYGQNRRAALAAATGDRVAVVSLKGYSTEAQVKALAAALPVVALLVAPPDSAPSMVVGSLATWANGQTAKSRDERDEIRKLIPTVTDTAFKDFYTAEVDRLDKAASSLTPTSAVVFAVVIRAPAAALQGVGARPDVRLVDVGDTADAATNAAFRGVRPEETATAGAPPIRPAA